MNRFPFEGPGRMAWSLGARTWGSSAVARLRDHPRITTLLGLAALAAALVLGAATDRPSSGNCFAGALSKDPIHCQVLTSAYDEGVLNIEAMYEGASVLYIFADNPESEWQAIEEYIFEEAKQASQAAQIPYCYEEPHPDWCNGGTLEISHGTAQGGALLPGSEQYADLRMISGGERALTEQAGWASFELLWPQRDPIFDGIGSPPSGERFDLSDVDLAITEEPDCYSGIYSPSGCTWWLYNPDLEIAGTEAWNWGTPSGIGFYQVKVVPGQERDQLAYVESEVLKRFPHNPDVGRSREIFIPVKYSFLDLWGWATLLDRFAQSQSNNIGVMSAEVGTNVPVATRETHYLTAAGLAPVEVGWESGPEDAAQVRATIAIWSFDPRQTIEALPQLLSQLGIPADAVGVVVDGNELPTGPEVPH